MKLPRSERAPTAQMRRAARQDTADDRPALAMDPPAYGIDLVDRASQTRRTEPQDMPADDPAMSMVPPEYGIDFVDRGLTGTASAQSGAGSLQRKTEASPGHRGAAWATRVNQTGLPDRLKTGVESLSGLSMDDVRVHYDSAQAAPLQALAYTQGTDIHIAPGQEQHLPHEAWHVVQQKQGRVEPTMELRGQAINDDSTLEREADVMGARAARWLSPEWQPRDSTQAATPRSAGAAGTAQLLATRPIVQRTWNHTRGENNEIQRIDTLDDKGPLVQAFGEAPDLGEKRLYLAKLLITGDQVYDDAAIRAVWQTMNEAQLNARYYQEYILHQHGWGGEQEAHLIAAHSNFRLEIQVGGRRWAIGAGNQINNFRLAWVNANHYVVVNAAGRVVHDPAERDDFASGDCLFYSLAYIFNQVAPLNHPAPGAQRVATLRALANQQMQQNGAAAAAQQGAELLNALLEDEEYDTGKLLNEKLSKGNDSWKKGSTWKTLKEESATLAHSQQFGVEVEFNFAKVPYELTKDFRNFAIAYGHLGIMEHKNLPIEMHLDHADPKNAKLELVSRPRSLDAFIETMKGLKGMMKKKPNLKDFAWIERSHKGMDIEAIKKAFLAYDKFGPLEFKKGEQPVQVTTTHTAAELGRVMEAVPAQLYPAQAMKWDENYRESISLRTLRERNQLTEANLIKWLGRLPAVKERGKMNFPVKGSDVLLKHAQEQFTSAPQVRRAKVGDETQADRIYHREDPNKKAAFAKDKALRERHDQLNNLHVLANKMAPVFKRKSGEIAFVMEYRVNSLLATTARDFLVGSITEKAFKEFLQKYNQGGD